MTPVNRQRLLIWLLLLLFAGWFFRPLYQEWLITQTATPRPVTARGDLAQDEQTNIAIFKAARASVVYITTIQHVRDRWTRNITRVPQGAGTGFIWDGHGHVVTNYHVLKDAQEAVVRLANQQSFSARLVGASRENDLAVLRIEAGPGLPGPLAIGASADLQVGQKVLAIGNPFGLDHTLTTGVISALDRSIDNDAGGAIEHLIQTDAAINPGNSGGPLLDSAGRLIGVNTAIYSPSGAYAGIGFAVPVDAVNQIVPQLIAHGRVRRPVLGVTANDELSERILSELGVTGVLVLQVTPGSPAEQVGLRPTQPQSRGRGIIVGDVVVSVDGEPVESVRALQEALQEKEVGDVVELGVWRNREMIKLQARLTGGG